MLAPSAMPVTPDTNADEPHQDLEPVDGRTVPTRFAAREFPG